MSGAKRLLTSSARLPATTSSVSHASTDMEVVTTSVGFVRSPTLKRRKQMQVMRGKGRN